MLTVAIDFETANENHASACSVGLAWIDGGTVVRTEERLIRPREMRFSSFNTAIHGIAPEDVVDAPEFPEFWEDFLAYGRTSLVLAHNATFDMSVLRASLDLYGLPWPSFSYLCTVKVARAVWPELDNHRLSTVADYLGVALEHHKAGSDAVACAMIALAATGRTERKDIPGMADALGVNLGAMRPGYHEPCRVTPLRKRRRAIPVG